MPQPAVQTRQNAPDARWFLERVLPSAVDFDALVLDHFPDVFRRFGPGMDRVAKTNLLLVEISASEILQALKEREPARFERFWSERRVADHGSMPILGNYRLLRSIGLGAQATVYEAEHLPTGRRHAIKILHWHLKDSSAARERFQREAGLGSRIGSEHAVQVLSAAVAEDGTPYLVMELLRGQTLADYLAIRQDGLPAVDVWDLCTQLGHALGAAHSAGVIHRDLKPENIFLHSSQLSFGPAWIVKVLDFGIAKIAEEAQGTNTAPLGSSAWAAPEQSVPGASITAATDIWAFGLLVFRMLVGHHYFISADKSASTEAIMREVVLDPLPFASVRAAMYNRSASLPIGFDHWFGRCVVRAAEQRFATISAALDELRPLLFPKSDSSQRLDLPLPDATRTRQPLKRTAFGILGALLMLVFCLAIYQGSVFYQRTRCADPSVDTLKKIASCQSICQRGGASQCSWLAERYRQGDGVVQDRAKALMLHQNACNQEYLPGCIYLGSMYLTGSGTLDQLNAAGLFLHACTGGNARGCKELATMFEKGIAIKQDFLRSRELYQRACDNGDLEGCYYLALLCQKGLGGEKDSDKAISLHKRACNGGVIQACVDAGLIYESDSREESDEKQVVSLYSIACENNNMSGCYHLGKLYAVGAGVTQDYKRAAALHQRACDGGEPKGCTSLGLLYEKGRGMEKSLQKATAKYRQACEKNDLKGCAYLGMMFENNMGVSQDFTQASQFYQKACDGGETLGCTSLGWIYLKGLGVDTDYERAFGLYQRACSRDDMLGCANLGFMYEKGHGTDKNLKQASILYHKACSEDEMLGCTNLAILYEHGLGVVRDLQEAVSLYRKSCSNGHQQACSHLSRLDISR